MYMAYATTVAKKLCPLTSLTIVTFATLSVFSSQKLTRAHPYALAALHTNEPLSQLHSHTHRHGPVHTVRDRDTLTHVEDVMSLHQVRRVPVVDAWSRLVGILSIDDLAREARRTEDLFAPAASPAAVGRTLAEICRPHLVNGGDSRAAPSPGRSLGNE